VKKNNGEEEAATEEAAEEPNSGASDNAKGTSSNNVVWVKDLTAPEEVAKTTAIANEAKADNITARIVPPKSIHAVQTDGTPMWLWMLIIALSLLVCLLFCTVACKDNKEREERPKVFMDTAYEPRVEYIVPEVQTIRSPVFAPAPISAGPPTTIPYTSQPPVFAPAPISAGPPTTLSPTGSLRLSVGGPPLSAPVVY